MEKEYIKEGIQVINEFMSPSCPLDQSNYNSDWQELMPVVEKIESTISFLGSSTYTVYIRGKVCRIHDGYEIMFKRKWDSKIEATFWCVVEFIKWYNKRSEF